MKKILPIGNDDFREIRSDNHFYYVDKTLFIKDFIEYKNKAALITRPRRFGKTLNMSMVREFFDITKDSRDLFDGLAIMDTKYAELINTRPVLFLSFKDCSADSAENLKDRLARVIFIEYRRYNDIFKDTVDFDDLYYVKFAHVLESLKGSSITWSQLEGSVYYLMTAITKFYGLTPLLLIDEYDQPTMSSYEHNFRKEMGNFFEGFYGLILKGNEYLYQALLTGIQRVAKESIFSKLNNIIVYTVLNPKYQQYFGLTEEETQVLLECYDLELTEEVKQQYDGYVFGETSIYNPWSVLNYADSKTLDNYWINTSTNYLVKQALLTADQTFTRQFHKLIEHGFAEVGIKLETSFIELKNNYTLWGLLVNSGYITIVDNTYGNMLYKVRIPNNEVKSEFQQIVAEQARIESSELDSMFQALLMQNMDDFFAIYSNIVLSCTSYFDAKENAYHMLFLGMCISLKGLYKITSNIESGHGRSDITLESLHSQRPHMIIEFKQGEDIEQLKKEGLRQIIDNKYYVGLTGEVLCIGLAHDIKYCEMEYQIINI